MNWNGQRENLAHMIAKLADPGKSGQLQAEFNAKRKARILAAVNTRPVFLPVSFEMTAAAQTTPYRSITQSLAYDVIITGIKADTQTRDIIIRRTESEQPLVYVGDETNLYLRADDIAGVAATVGGGQQGAFYLPAPIKLRAGERLTVEMFKTDVTAAVEEANIVFIGVRVFPKTYANELLGGDEMEKIDRYIAIRETPQLRFLKQAIAFDSAVAGGVDRNLYTPQVDEPLLIRGVRTTLRHTLIEVGVQSEPQWTAEATPIWAVAGEDEVGHDNYQWFSRPIYLHSRNSIEVVKLTNSIDGSLIDAQTGNTITWICETV